VPVCVCYAGAGFSPGILHLLEASPIAAYCLPGEDLLPGADTRELDVALALAFGWWDVIVRGKQPLVATPRQPALGFDDD
jgi:hypothetical protein